MLGTARPLVRLLLAALLAAAALAVVPGSPSSAGGAVLTVTTTDDVVDPGDGLLSLREAVVEVNAGNPATAIVLADGATYELDRCDVVVNEWGALDLDLDAPLRIQGDATIEQTCAGQRVFDVGGPETATLTLEDLTITSSADDPAGLVWSNVPLALVGVTFTGGYGDQPAVLATSRLIATGSTFNALEGTSHLIWGIDVELVETAITDSTAAIGIQGAIVAEDVEIRDNTFSANTMLAINQLDLLRVEVRGNGGNAAGAVLGGALSGSEPPLVTPFVVRDSVFRSNTTTGPGGGADPWCCPVLGFADVDAQVIGTTLMVNHDFGLQIGMWEDEEEGEPHDLLVQNSTLASNTHGEEGSAAGIGSPGAVELEHVTVLSSVEASSNVDDERVQVVAESLHSTSSYVVAGHVPSCSVGTTTSHGGNVSTDDTCGFTEHDDREDVPGDGVSWDFAPPDSAEPLPVMRPIGADPGLDLRQDPDCGQALPLDQVGNPRPQGAGCDTGAVETPVDPPPPPSFSDVPADHPFHADIAWLVAEGITTGFDDGTFRPSAPVSRQAMAAFLYRMAGQPPVALPSPPTFSDVGSSHPFRREVEWLADSGITGGYVDGTFRPSAPVTRQAMAAFLHRRAGSPAFEAPSPPTFPDVWVGNRFRTAIEWLVAESITTGYVDGTFRPANPVSRQAMAAFLHRIAND